MTLLGTSASALRGYAHQACAQVVVAFPAGGRGRCVVFLHECVVNARTQGLGRGVCGEFHAACAAGAARLAVLMRPAMRAQHVADKHFFATAHDAAQGALFIYG